MCEEEGAGGLEITRGRKDKRLHFLSYMEFAPVNIYMIGLETILGERGAGEGQEQ